MPDTPTKEGKAGALVRSWPVVRSFARVARMPDETIDPSGNTEAFRAFTDTPREPEQAASKLPLIIGGIVAAVVVIGLIAWLAL
jgi:hypothetical protein